MLAFDFFPELLEVFEAAVQAQVPGALVAGRGLRTRGDGPGLQEEKLVAAEGPLHVLGCPEMRFGFQGQPEHRQHLCRGKRWESRHFGGERPEFGSAVDRLHPMLPARRRVPHDLEILAVDDPAVGLHIAVDQPLVEPVDGFDKRLGRLRGALREGDP